MAPVGAMMVEESKKETGNGTLAYVSVLIAVGALIVSTWTFCEVHLKPAAIHIDLGEIIGVGYLRGEHAGMVIVPIVISNAGARLGVVHSMGLTISHAQKSDGKTLFLKWHRFAQYDPNFRLASEDMAILVPVQARSSIANYVVFKTENGFGDWGFEPRTYTFGVVSWTNADILPDQLTQFDVSFSPAESAQVHKVVADKSPTIVWMPRDNWDKWDSKRLSDPEIEEIRRLEHQPCWVRRNVIRIAICIIKCTAALLGLEK